MSAGELAACIKGMLNSRSEMTETDNRCCFCLTLRTGVIIIGIANFAVYLLAFSWYIGTVGFTGEFEAQISNVDITVFVLFCVQLLVNLLLIIGAIKRIPHQIFPWLCSNVVVIGIIMVFIFMLVFLGASRHSLSYHQYVSVLSLLSLLAGLDMFCCIVVFQFRKNLLIEASAEADEQGNNGALLFSNAPPPDFREAISSPTKLPLEDPPPAYEAAIAMSSPVVGDEGVPQLRKKSLTSQHV